MSSIPAVPETLKAIQPYIKIAIEHRNRDPVIAYWCYYYACQQALKIDKTSKESTNFIIAVMDWMENEKKSRHDNEAIVNDVVAQAHIENYALKLFLWADNEDRSGKSNKNVVKSFYTTGILYDIITVFGELTDEISHHRKYAKWKATYIHNCLKNGEIPIPGPAGGIDEDMENFRTSSEGHDQPTSSNTYFPATYDMPMPTPVSSFPSNVSASLVIPSPGVHAPPSTPNNSTLPSPSSSGGIYTPAQAPNGVVLLPEDIHKAQKYCKWAGSALQYEDVSTAIDNLQRALTLLTTGKDS